MKQVFRAWTVILGLMTFLSGGSAFGQTMVAQSSQSGPSQLGAGSVAELSGDASLQEVVVTAQKRAENIQDVPVAVSAFNAALLQSAHVQNITDLQALVPGFTIMASGASASNPFLSMRGISIEDVEKSTESGIGITVDGVPLGFSAGSLLDAFDIQQIEVLRGPQGTLFGKNTTGGTINITRSQPDPDGSVSGKFQVKTGSFDEKDVKGVFFAPIIAGKLAVKAGFDYEDNEGAFENPVFGGHDGARNFKSYQLALRATPTDKLDFTLSFDKQNDDSQYVPYVGPYVPNVIPLSTPGYAVGANIICTNPYLVASCTPNFNKTRNTVEIQPPAPAYFDLSAFTLNGSYDMGPVKAFSVTGYRASREFSLSDFDGTQFALFRDSRPQRSHQFSQELRAESEGSGPFKIVGGLFYYNGAYTINQRASLDLAGVAPVPPGQSYLNSISSYDATIGTRSYAIFAQAELKFLDKFKLILGGRQTWDRKTDDYTTYAAVPSTVREFIGGPVTGATEAEANFHKFTPKAVLQYDVASDIQAYVSYSVGYNSGGYNGRAASVDLIGPFKPETLTAYEVGFKSEWFDHRLRWNVSAYHNIMKDKQETLLIFVGAQQGSTTVNAAKVRYNGVDMELSVVPLAGWTISSSVGYLDAKYLKFVGNLGQGVANLSALDLPYAPDLTAGLVSDYSFPVGNGVAGINASLQYVGPFQGVAENDPRYAIPPTTRVNLGAHYKFPVRDRMDLELEAYGKNLTNNTTWAGGSSGGTVGTFIEEAFMVPGRLWGASVTLKF